MKLWDKIKNSIFEEDELEESDLIDEVKEKEKPVVDTFKDEVVKKIDIEKTIPKRIELPKEEVEEKKPILPKREHRVTPVIFDEDDFIIDDEPIPVPKKKVVNIFSFNEEHFGLQALQLKRLFNLYKCRVAVIDGNGLTTN